MSLNIFEQASKTKLRFSTTRGSLTTEDLWDLSLTDLDVIAIDLNKKVKESSEESFIKKANTVNKKLQLQFDVVKSIIDTKIADMDRAKAAQDRKTRRDVLINKIAEKQDAKLDTMSMTKLQAELDKIDEEDLDS